MRLPKVSVAFLMTLIIVAAADFSWFGWFVRNRESLFGFYPPGIDLGFVPVGSMLLLCAAYIASRRGKVGPFVWGFTLCGSAALMVLSTLGWFAATFMTKVMTNLYKFTVNLIGIEALEPTFRRYLPPIDFAYTRLIWVSMLLSVPHVLIAIGGGVLFGYVKRRRAANEVV